MRKLLLPLLLIPSLVNANPCNEQQLKNLRQPLKTPYYLTCDLSNETVTRKLIINESDVNLNNNKLTDILIQSKLVNNLFVPVTDVNLTKNVINGQLRISGHSRNGEDLNNVESSHKLNHTDYSKLVAPKYINIINNVFNSNSIKIYLSPGVNNITIKNNVIIGNSDGVNIYFDAESSNNNLINNKILASGQRESLAIDGSANNIIEGNYFSGIQNGGIFLYRNCGLNGAVRHQTSSNNRISNNIFYYQYCSEFSCDPSIWLASRNEGIMKTRGYCDDDKGYFKELKTSSTDNNDNVQNNIIIGNKIRLLDPSLMIRNTEFKLKNNISNNQRVE